jgi:hypothetical protein
LSSLLGLNSLPRLSDIIMEAAGLYLTFPEEAVNLAKCPVCTWVIEGFTRAIAGYQGRSQHSNRKHIKIYLECQGVSIESFRITIFSIKHSLEDRWFERFILYLFLSVECGVHSSVCLRLFQHLMLSFSTASSQGNAFILAKSFPVTRNQTRKPSMLELATITFGDHTSSLSYPVFAVSTTISISKHADYLHPSS